MLTRELLAQAVARHGRYLFHEPGAHDQLVGILRHGIRSSAALGSSRYEQHPLLHPRPEHAYLATGAQVAKENERGTFAPLLRVDLLKLDPERLCGDEDVVGACPSSRRKLSRLPGYAGLVFPSDDEPGGAWADRNAAIVDQPEWVVHSLEQGSVAVRGGVPAAAVELNPDVPAACFFADANGFVISPWAFRWLIEHTWLGELRSVVAHWEVELRACWGEEWDQPEPSESLAAA